MFDISAVSTCPDRLSTPRMTFSHCYCHDCDANHYCTWGCVTKVFFRRGGDRWWCSTLFHTLFHTVPHCSTLFHLAFDYVCRRIYNPRMNTRGPKRLLTITYGQIASWAGLTQGSIRNAVCQKRLDVDDIHDVLRWVNVHRRRRGLPMIGDPDVDTLDTQNNGQTAGESVQNPSKPAVDADTPERTEPRVSHPPSCRCNACYEDYRRERARAVSAEGTLGHEWDRAFNTV